MSLPNYDAWLEPPDEAPCDDGCILEDEHDQCWTAQDAWEEAQLQRWEQRRDDRL